MKIKEFVSVIHTHTHAYIFQSFGFQTQIMLTSITISPDTCHFA